MRVLDARRKPLGELLPSSERMALAVASAFEPGRWNIAIATAGSTLR